MQRRHFNLKHIMRLPSKDLKLVPPVPGARGALPMTQPSAQYSVLGCQGRAGEGGAAKGHWDFSQ